MDQPPHDPLAAMATALRADLIEVRAALVAALAEVPELWLGRALGGATTGRAGWTVQHEAAHHVADDVTLAALLEHASRGVEAWSHVEARRVRGEAMHTVQRLRLAPLRDHLAASGERAVAALEAHAMHLDRPFALGDAPPRAIAEVLRTQAARAREGVAAVRTAFGLDA